MFQYAAHFRLDAYHQYSVPVSLYVYCSLVCNHSNAHLRASNRIITLHSLIYSYFTDYSEYSDIWLHMVTITFFFSLNYK